MTEKNDVIDKLSYLLNEYISNGFPFDADIIRFINSTYGLSEANEIIDFLENDSDEALLGMISYPPDDIRIKIEEFLPADGLSLSDIKKIEDSVNILNKGCFIFFNQKIPLSKEDSIWCCKKFIQRLNLNVSLSFISNINPHNNNMDLPAVKALLRKKKFSSNNDCAGFINDLIFNLQIPENNPDEGYIKLIDILSDFFNGSDRSPFDILSEKKKFYIGIVLENAEFNDLLKSYTMEFIMMKKIRVPPVPANEAIDMIKLIDKITGIVYKTAIRTENL